MPNPITRQLDAWADFTLTLAALANNAARQATFITNSTNRPAAVVHFNIQSGAVAPTAGAIYEIFFLRADDSGNRTDNAGAADAAITIENAQLLGTLVVTATANKNFEEQYATHTFGHLSTAWATAVRNSSGQALNGTEGNHVKRFATWFDQLTT